MVWFESAHTSTHEQTCLCLLLIFIVASVSTSMRNFSRTICAQNVQCNCGVAVVLQPHCGVSSNCLGVRTQVSATLKDDERVELACKDLKCGLEGLARNLFGDVEMRWVDAYFPFTSPSTELEILFKVSALVVVDFNSNIGSARKQEAGNERLLLQKS